MSDLQGKTILVTRAAHQAEKFVKLIEEAGGHALVFPTIEIQPPSSWEACDRAIQSLKEYDCLIATSSNGAEYFLRRIVQLELSPVEVLATQRIFVVGEKTKEIFDQWGLEVEAMPEKATGIELASLLTGKDVSGKRFIFPHGNIAQDTIHRMLTAAGALVDGICVYETHAPSQHDIAPLLSKILGNEVDVITFTSPSTVRHFAALFSHDQMHQIHGRTRFAVIGPVTAEACSSLGFPSHITATNSTVESLIAAIASSNHSEHTSPSASHPSGLQNDLVIRAAYRKPVPRTPIWIMRQAGRYLPEYRAIRAKADFLTLCKTPELAAEVTIQPVDIIDVDAAIIFSDILVVPEAMGMELIVEEGKGGPQFPNPVRTKAAIEKLIVPDPTDKLRFVLDAVSLTRTQLAGRVPLIGFAGAPWTLAAYMIEGRGSKTFRHAKEMLYREPQLMHQLLERVTLSVIAYLKAKIEAGAQLIQLFDTWGGLLAQSAFEEFSLRYIREVVSGVRQAGVPVIVFCKDCAHSLKEIGASGCDVVGLDWTTDIGEARRLLEDRVSLQGNMDPVILYAAPDRIRSEAAAILKRFGRGDGHIFNLGHGINPDVPVEHVKELVKAVREESRSFH